MAACKYGAIVVELSHDKETGQDMYVVYMAPWKGRGEHAHLAKGTFGVSTRLPKEPFGGES